MKLDKTIELTSVYKQRVASLCEEIARNHEPQAVFLERRVALFASLPARMPSWAKAEIRAYCEGYIKAITQSRVDFLYMVDGAFYAPHRHAEGLGFPHWSTAALEQSELAKRGGLYWTDITPPRPWFLGARRS